jgi:hypothetical protein
MQLLKNLSRTLLIFSAKGTAVVFALGSQFGADSAGSKTPDSSTSKVREAQIPGLDAGPDFSIATGWIPCRRFRMQIVRASRD